MNNEKPVPSELSCDECGGPMPPDYDPMYCCNQFDCPCQGRATNPPFCSEKCWNEGTNQETP